MSRTETKDDAGQQATKSGFFQSSSPVNYPAGASNWWHLLDVRHTNTANNYAMQFSGSFFDQDLYFRKTGDNASQSWSRVLLENPGGMVGIGTTSPQAKLDIVSGSQGASGLRLGNIPSSIGSSIGTLPQPIGVDGNGNVVPITGALPTLSASLGAGTMQALGLSADAGTANYNTSDLNDGGNGIGIIVGANIGAPTIWMYNYGNNNAFTVARKSYSGQGPAYLDGKLEALFQVRSTGNVGIGTTDPQSKLDVAGQVRITDGSQGAGRVLTCDANGLASWQIPSGGNYLPLSGGTLSGSLGIGGNVLIGKITQANTAYRLDVAGPVRADKLTVNTTGADFVFDSSYQLSSLSEVERYVKSKGHLPGIAPAAEMQKNGVELGENQAMLLQKIEELTLYIISQDKKQRVQDEVIAGMKKELDDIKTKHPN